jgi:hypothetical protein
MRDYTSEVNDELLHCFATWTDELTTLCGQKYDHVQYANWPSSFKNFEGVGRCQKCVDHPDLPLLILGDV